MTDDLRLRANQHGIHTVRPGHDGRLAPVPEETLKQFLQALETDRHFDPPDAIAPGALPSKPCHMPDWLLEGRAWGIAVQLYELRSGRDWGIGDFADLTSFCRIAAAAGADFVGLNPLHALFLAEPARCSPFSPSNRRFLNPLYIAVDRVPGFEERMAPQAGIERLRELELVDYRAVAALKLDVLQLIWTARQAQVEESLAAFREEGGAALEHHAVFEAISAHMVRNGHGCGWLSWPPEFRRANSPGVVRFAREHADAISFHVWLQWLARLQLDEAEAAAREAGMRIGLYLDLAVGEAPDGSATWSDPGLVVNGVHIGAPPDVFTSEGQDWGLAPLSPHALAANDFASYRNLMKEAVRSAGAVRIDHAMSLRQVFWIPAERAPSDGSFVTYPMEGLLDVLSEISRVTGTIVIGEDLGHVPSGFRDDMARAGILSYRILYFEQRDGRFVAPRNWPFLALACLSTHDLPTLLGWWAGDDIALRREYDLIGPHEEQRQRRTRRAERRNLADLMAANAVLPRRKARTSRRAAALPDNALIVAAHRLVARTPCRLASLRLADAVGERHPTNLPGVADSYPNWRRRLGVPLERLAASTLFTAVTEAFRQERPR